MGSRLFRRRCLLAAVTTAIAIVSVPAAAAAEPLAAARVQGVVLDPSGTPVAAVEVTDQGGHTVSTNANGRFVLTGVVSEIVCAVVQQDQDLGGPSGWARVCADVAPSGTSRVTLKFTPGAAVSGQVTDARTGGPVAGAAVDISALGTGTFEQEVHAAPTTDAYGRFRYRNLPAGILQQPAARAGGPESRSASAPYGYDGSRQLLSAGNLLLQPGQVRDDLNFVVAPLVRYSGTVADRAGARVPNAFVAVQTSGDYTTVTVSAQGRYSVDAPWRGTASVCAWSRASSRYPTGLAAVCRKDSETTTTVTRRLSLGGVGGTLTGRVLTPDGSIAAPTVSTMVSPGDVLGFPLPGVVTGTGYRIDGVPPSGSLTVVATVATTTGDIRASSRPVGVRAAAVTTVPDITLRTGGV